MVVIFIFSEALGMQVQDDSLERFELNRYVVAGLIHGIGENHKFPSATLAVLSCIQSILSSEYLTWTNIKPQLGNYS